MQLGEQSEAVGAQGWVFGVDHDVVEKAIDRGTQHCERAQCAGVVATFYMLMRHHVRRAQRMVQFDLGIYREQRRIDDVADLARLLGTADTDDLRLPLLSFEAASDGQAQVSPGSRVAVINALGGRAQVKFIALLVQGIPRSVKVGPDLVRAEARDQA